MALTPLVIAFLINNPNEARETHLALLRVLLAPERKPHKAQISQHRLHRCLLARVFWGFLAEKPM
jgi:hypothetical protein